MKSHMLLAGALVVGVVSAVAADAQQTAPLVYSQALPPQQVQAVQERLRQAGVYSGGADGVWGPDSQAALERFQQSHQLQVTGQLNQATAATLGFDPNAPLAASQAAVLPSLPPADQLRPASVRAVQARLRGLNFYNGAVDGMWGGSTQSAIERFQQGRGLQPNGQLNPATLSAMGLAPDSMAYR